MPAPAPKPGHTGGVIVGRPVQRVEPPRVVRHDRPSHLGNPWSRQHIGDATGRFGGIRQGDPNWYNRNHKFGEWYWSVYRQILINRALYLQNLYRYQALRYYYSRWYHRGFYGGFYYPVRRCNIHTYFHYPVVNWLYAPQHDDDYWGSYYRHHWDDDDGTPSAPVDKFEFAGVFYPTDTLRDLAIEVSGMKRSLQRHFRGATVSLVKQLQRLISDQLETPITLGQYDVVINHYQNLRNEAIAVEGFVARKGVQYAFKALLDLEDSSNTMVFVPTTQEDGGESLAVLEAINAKIVRLGGDPYTANQEPAKRESGSGLLEDSIDEMTDILNM